jgi:hypothetical protein
MWRSLLTDLESVLKGAKAADVIRVPKSGPASRGEDAAAFSEWLPVPRLESAAPPGLRQYSTRWASAWNCVRNPAPTKRWRAC